MSDSLPRIIQTNLTDPVHAAALVRLLDAYASEYPRCAARA